MKTTEQIRLHNLLILLKECEADTGPRGAAALLSRKTTVPAALISQLRNSVTNKSGRTRTIGDETARKLEGGMRKRIGWMDQDHSLARNIDEAAMLDLMRALTPTQLSHIIGTAEEFAGMNAATQPGALSPEDQRQLAPARRPREH